MDKRTLLSAASAIAFIFGIIILSVNAFTYLSGQGNANPRQVLLAIFIILTGFFVGKKARQLKSKQK